MKSMDCIFCKIISGEIPSNKVYEDEKVYAFYDIEPAAPTHFLVIPKEHIESALAIDESNQDIIGHCYTVIAKIVKKMGLKSYRVVTNCGEEAGQSVFHLHFHILAGRNLSWPPG